MSNLVGGLIKFKFEWDWNMWLCDWCVYCFIIWNIKWMYVREYVIMKLYLVLVWVL